MKWKCKESIGVKPKHGDERVVSIFCVTPTKIDGYYYWFETLTVLQRFIEEEDYVYTSKHTSVPINISCWKNIRLATNEDSGFYHYN